ncbi:GroES-like zinc-binding alcohol dehydrogenase family protein [Gossypium australe]|uniref:GroES-like zinc-binding alcohol dehydrogenase family protein n=1 Tax=Gossypium australe TaxID=47621 RepID=A0A5B6U6X8_9ROSI|nr:GroES-like zinc-binding alcohol dehydrogenase family protein [Gossypium australe]
MDLNPAKPYPSVVMTWIRFLGLSGHMCKNKILWEIGEMVGKVVKLDLNTDNKARDRYPRMAVYVNLEKPLISKVLINGNIQRIEYESLPLVCFSRGRYGHFKESCGQNKSSKKESVDTDTTAETDSFGPWMLVEWKIRRQSRELQNLVGQSHLNNFGSVISKARNRELNPKSVWVEKIKDPQTINELGEDTSPDALGKRVDPSLDLGSAGAGAVDGPETHNIATQVQFNLAFEGPEGAGVLMNEGVLDPGKHSAVIFKDKNSPFSHRFPIKQNFESMGASLQTLKTRKLVVKLILVVVVENRIMH